MRSERGRRGSSEIERDIASTRREMDETVSEIQRRLQPERLRDEASRAVRDTFRTTAQGAQNRMLDTIKENPLPSVLAGVSLGWLIAKGASSSSDDRRSRYDQSYDRDYRRSRSRRRTYYDEPSYETYDVRGEPVRYGEYEQDRYYDEGYGDDYEPRGARYEASAQRQAEQEYREQDSESGSEGRSVGARASDAAGQAQEQTRQYSRQAQQYGRQAQRQAQQYGRQAQRQARRAQSQMEYWMEDNPMAVGAATLAIGAFAGLMLPATRKENELMGETRDRVVHQAQDAARETAQRAQRVAEKTAEEAKETAKEETEAEKEKAQSDRK